MGTPIGNLGDLTPRAAEILRSVATVAAEDTRQAAKLLNHLGIRVPTVSYHEHNAGRRQPELLARLERGEHVALVTDAGMPAISDPGSHLVRAAAAAGHPVEVVPGPSALTAALAVSGLEATRFVFEGFPPREGKARRRLFRQLAGEHRAIVFFEGPHRLAATLGDLAAILGADRQVAVCRELTKVHEEVFRATLGDAAAHYATHAARGEITLVVGPAPRPATAAE
ncbi:MAG: 16S rRNA (cytidine(1402)-2'-O)-methyltransferase [Candidatus Sericytochromatia bacterium]|nr:16S rRNA (cytidine(1402)-2'-O)-methyltransferase [Candidatus Tanganyikabacteria bacterium]